MSASTQLSVMSHLQATSDLSVAEASSLSKSKNIKAIQHTAHSMGLSADIILIIIREIESEELPTPLKLELMHCLIPKHTVPEAAFIKMTCLLSDFKFDLNLKVEILKWMISVFAFVNSTKFRSFYEVFLQLLENETLRPYICHLLHLITDKQQVTMKRIKYIVRLLERLEPQECLTSILHLYSKLQPQIFGLTPEKEFQHNFESLGIYPELIKKVHRTALSSQSHVFIGERKYSVADTSFHFEMAELSAAETLMDTFAVSKAPLYNEKCLLAYSSFAEMYKCIQILNKSHNMQHILKSKYRRLYLTSDTSPSVRISFSDFLLSSLCSDFDADILSDVLEIIYEMQETNTAISDFIRIFIEFWDGYTNFYPVLEIMSYHEICCFGKIRYSMNYIKDLLLGAPVIYKCHCLYYFSKMYQNWALMNSQSQHLILCDDNCSMFSENDSSNCQYHLYENVVHFLGSYIDLICETLILSENDFQHCLLNQVLLHYEKVSIVHIKSNSLVIHLPTSSIYCSALFSLSSYTLDYLSRLVLRHNAEVHALVANNHVEAFLAAKFFKRCFVDLCNILYKGRYSTRHEKTLLFKTPIMKRLKQLCPNYINLFILHQHPALLLKTVSFLEFNQLNNSPSSLKNLPDSESYFRYLSENGFEVLTKLIYLFYHTS